MMPKGPSDIPLSYRLRYTLARTEEGEGFSVGTVLASYIHLHVQSNPGLAREFVRRVARSGSGPVAALATRSVLR
jgi:cobyrinic acid a,c-diamide synthase